MKFSVVIPALNEEKIIGECIKEVKRQAPSAEIILVDGMSVDKTVEIAKELGVRVLVEKKKTVSAARNTGLMNASGDIICFIDADVIPDNSWFEKLTSPFIDETVMAVAGVPKPIDGKLHEKLGMSLIFGTISPLLFKLNIPLVTGQIMAVRKKEAIEAGGFNTDHKSGEDTYIFLILRNKGKIVHSGAAVKVSMRRIRNWGILKYLLFNVRNYISLLKYAKPIDDDYEPIRQQ